MFSKKRIILIITSIAIIAVILIIVKRREKEVPIVELKAKVVYADKKLTITNTDTMDFINAKICLDKYYWLNNTNILAGETYDIWQVEFLHHNSIHYPVKYTPRKITIWCDTKYEKNGFYSKKLN